MQIEELYKIYTQHRSVQTDTRQLKPGDIFFALKGDSFNGNQFASQAIDSGAAYAVIDEKEYSIPGKTLLVDDVLTSLQNLAQFHREQFRTRPDGKQVPFIAITGSNGKTTTKELLHAVLATTYKTYTTKGNLNNHIGIPLTILRIEDDAEMAVIEMGANHIGEIASYCKYAQPTHGIINNAGKAHLEGFGSEEGVKKGKGELFDYLRTLTHGIAFVNWDYDYLRDMSKGISGIIKYGTKEGSHLIGHAIESDPFLQIKIEQGMEEMIIPTILVGDYNLPNALAAITVGKYFKVPETSIREAISSYTPGNSRSQLLEKDSNHFILDAYNANPSSMRVAIENFARMEAPHKVVMLGSMAELGEASQSEHQAIVDLLSKSKWDHVVLVGNHFANLHHPFIQFDNSDQAAEWWKKQDIRDSHVLIKGSRSARMEKIIEKQAL